MQLGRYEILETIGRGASSTVFKARDTLIGRIVAVKTLQPGLSDTEWREHFLAEAHIIGQLSHPRIVSLHDVGIDEASGAPYLVMEYITGQTLEQLIAAGKTVPRQAYTWGAALARALADAHERGVIHGDVKPANILINQDGRVKLTDFGIARFAAHISQSGRLKGTPAYLSPEQIEGKPTDGRSDLFSLGIVLYQLATGRRPFEGGSVGAVCTQILRATITPPTKINPTLPRALDGVLARCLARNPADRYANGEELAAALESVARETPVAARRKAARNRSAARAFRYAGVACLLLVALFAPIAVGFYTDNLQLPPAPAAVFPAPKPPNDQSVPLQFPLQAARPKSGPATRKRKEAPKPNPVVAAARPQAAPAPKPAPLSAVDRRSSASTAGTQLTIELSAGPSDGTVAVFADHQLVFSTPLASAAEAKGEPFRAVCTLSPGQHHLRVALYKADNSLRAHKEGLADLRQGAKNLLAIRVIRRSKVLLLRGTGLDVTWPTGSAEPGPKHRANDSSTQAAVHRSSPLLQTP